MFRHDRLLLFLFGIVGVLVVILFSVSTSLIADEHLRTVLFFAVTTTTTYCFLLGLIAFGMLRREFSSQHDKIEEEKKQLLIQVAKGTAIISSIAESVIVTDAKGIVTFVNDQACKLLGIEQDEWLGRDYLELCELFTENKERIDREKRPLSKALLHAKSTSSSQYILVRKKKKIPIALSVAPVIVKKKVVGAVQIMRDITKEKAVDTMKSEFISLASHQLRTPLTAISWICEMLLDGDYGTVVKAQKEQLKQIAASNQRMIRLVSALLDISRIESGRLHLDPSAFQLSAIISDVLKDLQSQVEKKNLKVRFSRTVDIPTILADEKMIRQVVLNLISNAIKYTPEQGKILIKLSSQGSFVQCTIEDTGVGIPLADQDRVFDKFYRGNNILVKDTDGTGLGLYLAKAIIRSSRGKIWFKSAQSGTTFYFTLPKQGEL